MIHFHIKVLTFLVYGGFYYWWGYSSMTPSEMPGFWSGVLHGYLWVARLVCELWMDLSSLVEPHAEWYRWGYTLGIFIAISIGYLIELISQLITVSLGIRR